MMFYCTITVSIIKSSRHASEVTVTPVPQSDAFKTALQSMDIAKALSPTSRKLLRTLYGGPGHTRTTMEIAREMGWPTHGPVNLHYGTFAQGLAKRMGWVLPVGAPQITAIATFAGGSADDPHTRWTMHPELASALLACKIVTPVRPSPLQT